MVRIEPLLIVNAKTVGLLVKTMVLAPVVAITAESPVPGATSPTHEPPTFQSPPVVLLVITESDAIYHVEL